MLHKLLLACRLSRLKTHHQFCDFIQNLSAQVPDAVTYTALIDACGRAAMLDQAFALFARCVRPPSSLQVAALRCSPISSNTASPSSAIVKSLPGKFQAP